MEGQAIKGFVPLQQLQAIAREKMQKKQKEEQMAIASKKLVVDRKIYNKYQISKDTIFYIKFGVYFKKQQKDRLIIVDYDKGNAQIQNHWLKFRMWTYQQCNKLKDMCCQKDQYGSYVYNQTKLFRVKIKHLLLDWSFKQFDPNMQLMHVDGILSDQSIQNVMSLHTNILMHIQKQLKNILQANE